MIYVSKRTRFPMLLDNEAIKVEGKNERVRDYGKSYRALLFVSY